MTAVLTDRQPDFSGYATRAGLECSDGRVITGGAFKHNDQKRVPLVWQHNHDDPGFVLGYAILEHREDGMYTYGYFNDTDRGKQAKQLVQHGDITAMSIHANKLKQQGMDVLHGDIKEVSLVLAGANPGAFIDNVNLQHSDSEDALVGEAIIYTDDEIIFHAEGETVATKDAEEKSVKDVLDELNPKQKALAYTLIGDAMGLEADEEDADEVDHAEGDDDATGGETVQDLWNTFPAEAKEVVHGLIGQALNNSASHSDEDDADLEADAEEPEEGPSVQDVLDSFSPEEKQAVVEYLNDDKPADDSASHSDSTTNSEDLQHNQEGSTMPRNLFEQNGSESDVKGKTLSHGELKELLHNSIVSADKSKGNLSEAILEHAGTYGIDNIEVLFPEARTIGATPELIARQADWVPKVLGATKHSPFAHIKSISADLTADEARAKGYIKGTEKQEEVIPLLRRTTRPTTVYKKQKLDRDDIIDITDIDVVAWLKWEIRFMLNEEIARAILIGDGRSTTSDDKIKDPAGVVDGVGIRSIANDSDLYAVKVQLAANVAPDVLIDEITRARTQYRGSGSPTLYTTDKVITSLFLLKDKMARRLYNTEAELASALRVKEIVAVEVMEQTPTILGIMVNLTDYTVGANKGGELSFFEDFDIDFNQHKYLLETRISGALTKPKSAIVIRRNQGTLATPVAPSFDGATDTITIPTVSGVVYRIDGAVVTGNQVISAPTTVEAEPAEGYYFDHVATDAWTYAP